MKFNKKGITLVETLLTIVLLSVVLAAIFVALSSFGGQYKGMSERLKAQESASLIAESLELAVRYANTAYISNNDNSFGCEQISSHEGKLHFKGIGASDFEPFMQKESYNGYNCNLIFTKENDNSIKAEIIIYKDTPTDVGTDAVAQDIYLYKTTRTLKLLNTADDGREITTSIVSDINGVTHILKYK